ncbi:MAG: M15 family metallopeptidase [Mariniphaga sp.]|nr:M15 family metallopeptidase [Mariniphaga sp.]
MIRHLLNTFILLIIVTVGYVCYTIIYDLRVHIINRSELNDLAGINADYAARFERFVNDIENESGWKVKIISGLRSRDEQIQLKRDNPRNAAVSKSRHVLGRAIDINLYKRVGLSTLLLKKSSSKASWRKTGVPEIAKRYQLLWGGTYRNYHDPVHFEIN